MPAKTGAQSSFALLTAVAAVALSCCLIAFYPGALSFDSAYQWWQARGHETTNIHGLGMTWLWRLSDAITQGPGLLFVLQLAFLWCGLILIAVSLPVCAVWRGAFMLIAAFAPVVFVLFSAVSSDAMLAGVLCGVVGILVWRDGKASLLSAMTLLFLALLLRKNALLAVLPLVIWAMNREFSRARHVLLAAICVVGAMYGASVLLEHTVDRRVTVFPATALWDLAALSAKTGDVLLPPASHDPGLTIEEVRGAFVPYANAPLFERARIMQPFLDPDDPANDAIRRSWIDAVFAHPRLYLAHRWQLTRRLFGSKQPDWPHELVYFSANTQYQDNPPLAKSTGRLHDWFMARFDELRASALFAPWPYLLLAGMAGIVGWRRRRSVQAQAALAVAASGLLYAAPLPLIAPSVELRYVGWTCLSAVISAALALGARSSRAELQRSG